MEMGSDQFSCHTRLRKFLRLEYKSENTNPSSLLPERFCSHPLPGNANAVFTFAGKVGKKTNKYSSLRNTGVRKSSVNSLSKKNRNYGHNFRKLLK